MKYIWLIFQYNENGDIINSHLTAFSNEEEAIEETKWQNKNELSGLKWDYEIFKLKS